MERVSVLVQVDCPGSTVHLQGPPSQEEASAAWMEKFAALLRPLGEELNTFRCVLFGSLAEVASHLWLRQALWMRLVPGQEGEERHVSVPLSEVVEPSADYSAGRYHNTVMLEEETLDGTGQVSIAITLEVIREDLGLAKASLQPSLEEVFLLHLQLAKGGSALVAQAARRGSSGNGLSLRCCGLEQPLQESMDHTLVLVSTWGEVPMALLDLDVCVEAPTGHDIADLPLDLSELTAAAADRGGQDGVTAQVKSAKLPGQSVGLCFTASVRSLHWSTQLCRLQAGRTKDAEQLWAEGLSAAPRTWRISVEIRSLRLITCTANAFIVYTYELLQQPRPFRTNPPVLARKNNTVYLPHGFAAYTLTATSEELGARLEDPLRVELWHRDLYAKDSLIGLAEFGMGNVFEQPLQYSASMPSMVSGFRVLDQVCPILSTADASPGAIGKLRVLLFVEDLGPAAGASSVAQLPLQAPPAPALVPPGSGVRTAARPSTSTVSPPPPATPAGGVAAVTEAVGVDAGTTAALEGLQALRSSPEYSRAFQLELWKRAEEEKFRAYLKEEEASMREGLEDDYRQRELQRAKEFRQRQNELKDLEGKVRKKFQELQQREVAVASEEARVSAHLEEVKRRADRTVQEQEDASRRLAAEAEHALRMERDNVRHLEAKMAEVEAELATTRQRCKDVEAEAEERRRKLEEMPQSKLRDELQEMQLQLRDAERRGEALAASRDHFRRKVEELCRRLLTPNPGATMGAGAAALPEVARAQVGYPSDAAEKSADAGMQEMTEALRKMQEHLGELAREWGSPASRGPAQSTAAAVTSSVWTPPAAPMLPPSPLQSGMPAMQVAAQNASAAPTAAGMDAGAHLAWLQGQREELLQSGLYNEGDPVLRAIDARIIEAYSVDGVSWRRQ